MCAEYPSVFKSNTSGHIVQGLFALPLFILGIWLLVNPLRLSNIPSSLILSGSLFITLISGLTLVFSILRILRPIPELEFTNQGFSIKVGLYTRLSIAWEDVLEVSFINEGGHQILAVMIKHPNTLNSLLRGWARIVIRSRQNHYGTPVILTSKRLRRPFEEIQHTFVWHQQRAKSFQETIQR